MSTKQLLSFEQAQLQILNYAKIFNHQQQIESVKLFDAVGRITAEPIVSSMNVPSFDNSAMDGYAVRFSDLEHSLTLPVAASVLAGNRQPIDWPANSCLRIMTGAPVPSEADAVVMQEDITKQGDQIVFPPLSQIKKNQNIRRIGENVMVGQTMFSTGEKLTIPKLSTLASLGLSTINVYKPLKVAMFSTGDELTPIGEPLTSDNQIYDSNRFAMHLMLKALGCEVIDLGIVKDDEQLITDTLLQASQSADLVITSGGVSVGDADYTKKALEGIGQINFWKIAMKPGKPFAFGQINKSLFCGLPGNPVSTLVTFYQLVKPLILTLSGLSLTNDSVIVKAKSVDNLKKKAGRLDFQRGYYYTNEDGKLMVQSTGQQDSHLTTSFHQANCFIVLEKERDNVTAGEVVHIEPFAPMFL